jgi:hypothetical protein
MRKGVPLTKSGWHCYIRRSIPKQVKSNIRGRSRARMALTTEILWARERPKVKHMQPQQKQNTGPKKGMMTKRLVVTE